jgi:hypothetical protein
VADLYSDIYGDIYGDVFVPGTGPADGIKVEVDWNRDGDFTGTNENVTRYIRRSEPISLSYGRDPGTTGSVVVQGQGGVVLNNSDRRFSSRNTASPLYGLIKPARPVRVTRNIGGSTYTLFRGHTDETPLNPDPTSKSVALSLVDYLGDFRGKDLTTAMYSGIRTGAAINVILDACDWDPALRDIDPGATVMPWWWEDGTDAMTALDKLVRSEGSPALLTVGTSGEVIFRDRHHRRLRTTSSTVQSTWRDTGKLAPVIAREFSYDESWQNIVNTASAEVDQRQPQDLQVVWSLENFNTNIQLFTPQTVWAKLTDPVIGVVTPTVSNGDIVKTFPDVVGNVTATLIQTSGQTIGITLSAGLRVDPGGEHPVPRQARHRGEHDHGERHPGRAITADYGKKAFSLDAPWCNAYDAQAILDQIVSDRAQPLPVVTTKVLVGRDVPTATAILSRDLSDRVRVKETQTLLDDDFFIESIQHDLSGEHDHEVTFALEHVPPDDGTTLFTVGTSLLDGTDVLG